MAAIDLAIAAYCVVGAGLMAQGLRYLLAVRYMHYHAEVVKMRWSDLGGAEQRLMLGLLRGFGAGMFCVGIAVIFIAIEPLRRGALFVQWFLGFFSIVYTALLVHVTRFALLRGAAPILVTTTMCAMCLGAAALSIAALR
jgi:hypothetical protein